MKSCKRIFGILIILTMALGIIGTPMLTTVKSQTLSTIQTELYMTVEPNPIGVGQEVTATVWLDLPPIQTTADSYYGWNFTVEIVPPSGSNTTLGPFESASNGGYFTTFTPKVAGNYTFQAYFAKTTLDLTMPNFFVAVAPGVYTYTAAISKPITLDVQSTPIAGWTQTPLPTSYWQNPIFAENQNWYVLAGNWLYSPTETALTPCSPALYTTGPNTAHILYTKPIAMGGISGGEYSSGNSAPGSSTAYSTSNWGVNYYTGLLYQEWFHPIIINGYLFYNELDRNQGTSLPGVVCINLRTGAVVWENDSMPQLIGGQVFTFQGGDQSGSLAYLWSANNGEWQLYDAFTGRQLTTFDDLPPDMLYQMAAGLNFPYDGWYGPNGELLVYIYNSETGYLAMWNSTLAVLGPSTGFAAMSFTPEMSPVTDWMQGIQWNVTIPPTVGNPTLKWVDCPDGVLVAEGSIGVQTANPIFTDYGYSTTTGAQLWAQNRTNVGWGELGPGSNIGLMADEFTYGDGYYAFLQLETNQFHVINVLTGIQAFVTQPITEYTGTDLSYYDWGVEIANGVLFTSGYSGDVVAFNVTTGTHLWTFTQANSGLQTPFGSWPSFGSSGIVADGKLYWGVTQHSPGTPLLRGYNLYCINFTTGNEIWEIPGFFPSSSLGIGDGVLVGYAGYDNQMYAFGTGPSKTTVTAPDVGVTTATPITITGTVTDISAGSKQDAVEANFPNGLPCVSDASMSQFMEAVYQQQPMPDNITGVPVAVYVLDSNNNSRVIGTTTTNANGFYSLTWTPDVPGNYTVTAIFAGTQSYYGSSANTAFYASAASTETATPAPVAANYTTTNEFMIGIFAIAILIVVCVAVLVILMMRRKP